MKSTLEHRPIAGRGNASSLRQLAYCQGLGVGPGALGEGYSPREDQRHRVARAGDLAPDCHLRTDEGPLALLRVQHRIPLLGEVERVNRVPSSPGAPVVLAHADPVLAFAALEVEPTLRRVAPIGSFEWMGGRALYDVVSLAVIFGHAMEERLV